MATGMIWSYGYIHNNSFRPQKHAARLCSKIVQVCTSSVVPERLFTLAYTLETKTLTPHSYKCSCHSQTLPYTLIDHSFFLSVRPESFFSPFQSKYEIEIHVNILQLRFLRYFSNGCWLITAWMHAVCWIWCFRAVAQWKKKRPLR